MITTTGHAITPEIKAYADAVRKCAEHSISHPMCSLKDNPFESAINPLHKKAVGSVRVIEWCPGCANITPWITDDLITECCGHATLNFNDHRRR